MEVRRASRCGIDQGTTLKLYDLLRQLFRRMRRGGVPERCTRINSLTIWIQMLESGQITPKEFQETFAHAIVKPVDKGVSSGAANKAPR